MALVSPGTVTRPPLHSGAMADPGRLCVLSPHLDDGVLSCGRLLAATPGATVLTALGGDPPRPAAPAHSWDRTTTGERRAGQAVALRQAEDCRAAELLGADARHLAWSEYHRPLPDRRQLADGLARALAEVGPSTVVAPVGLLHPHHLLVHRAALTVARHGGADVTWYLYADTPYSQAHPDELAARLAQISDRTTLAEVELPQAPPGARVAACAAYASQLPELRRIFAGTDEALAGPERYWRITAARPS